MSTILLEEQGGARRRVLLEQTALPERGVAVESRSRMQTTWYPGASEASVQLLGVEERPITFRGWLRDRWLGTVGGALALNQELEALLRGQQEVILTWTETQEGGVVPLDQQPIVRRGYVTMYRPEYDRAADIAYELEFTPTGADEAVIATAAAQRIPLPTQFELADLLDLLGDALELVQTASAVTNAAQAIL